MKEHINMTIGPKLFGRMESCRLCTAGIAVFCLPLLFAFGIYGQVPASIPVFVTFDAPGAGVARYQGTTPVSVNAVGTIAGYYVDGRNARHGFVRAASGILTTFDA